MDNMPDLRSLFETAQRMQAQAEQVRQELAGKTVDAETGGGFVRCTANGRGEIVALTIDGALAGSLQKPEDKRMLEDLVVGAVNLALQRAQELAARELQRVTAGLPLPPGMFGG